MIPAQRATRRASRRESRGPGPGRVVEDRLLELVEPILELFDLRPVVVDHRVDDAMEERDRPFAQNLRVARTVLAQVARSTASRRRAR